MSDKPADRTTSTKPVVTIFEYYGAGASEVGDAIAQALGLPFHGQAFSSEALEGGQGDATEEAAMLVQVFSVLGGAYGGFEGRDVVATQQQKYDLVMQNNRQVWAFAQEGGVIVGRNGAVVLADRPNTLHVLLTGSVEDRVQRAAQEAGISREHAAGRQKREDEVRAAMSLVLYGWDPRLPDRYDLVVNTSRVSPAAAARAIVAVLASASS